MKRSPLAIIFLIVFVDLMGFGIVIPILPSYAQRGFGASDFTVGLIVASFSFMQFLFTPLWGKLSDRIGRKPVLTIGLAASVIGYILFGLVNSIALLFFSRILAGIGGANISAAQAYIADVTTHENRARGMGLIGAAFGLGFVFGPTIGGLLSGYGYHVPGFFAAGLSCISLLLTVFVLPESRGKTDPVTTVRRSIFSIRDLRYLTGHKDVGKLLVFYFFITFAAANTYATFPLFATKDFNMTDHQVGYLFACIGLAAAIMQGRLIRHIVKRVNERVIFLIGNVFMMLGFIFMPLMPSMLFLFLMAIVYSAGSGANLPTGLSLISQSAKPEEQGLVLGINQSLSSLARVLGPINGAFFFQHFGHRSPFIAAGVTMLGVTFLSAFLVRDYLNKKKIGLEQPVHHTYN